eukprot:366464-Chlamydomonas_euryale.AAC.10
MYKLATLVRSGSLDPWPTACCVSFGRGATAKLQQRACARVQLSTYSGAARQGVTNVETGRFDQGAT